MSAWTRPSAPEREWSVPSAQPSILAVLQAGLARFDAAPLGLPASRPGSRGMRAGEFVERLAQDGLPPAARGRHTRNAGRAHTRGADLRQARVWTSGFHGRYGAPKLGVS